MSAFGREAAADPARRGSFRTRGGRPHAGAGTAEVRGPLTGQPVEGVAMVAVGAVLGAMARRGYSERGGRVRQLRLRLVGEAGSGDLSDRKHRA